MPFFDSLAFLSVNVVREKFGYKYTRSGYMDTESSHLKRIAWAIKTLKKDESLDKGITDAKLSHILGVDKNTLVRYRQCKGTVKSVVVGKLITHYNFNPRWLFLGQGEPFPGARTKYPEVCGPPADIDGDMLCAVSNSEFLPIPYMPDPSVHNMDALKDDHYISLWFRRSWIDKIGGKSDYLVAIKLRGDCMSPTLMYGDLLLVTRDPVHLRSVDGLCVVIMGKEMFVRRVQYEYGSERMIKLMCDNDKYETILTSLDSVVIYGKVIWYARSLVG